MPGRADESQLRAVLSFYYSVVNVTPEGDSIVSGDRLQGLGTVDSCRSFLYTLFGSLLRVAFPSNFYSGGPPDLPSSGSNRNAGEPACDVPSRLKNGMDVVDGGASSPVVATAAAQQSQAAAGGALTQIVGDGTSDRHREKSSTGSLTTKKKFKLTDCAPDPGYFLAGAIAGGVSRTATAPLDRLKVYLLVNTTSGTDTALAAMKKGHPIEALKNSARPFTDAMKDLYRSGGLRGFFAGEFFQHLPPYLDLLFHATMMLTCVCRQRTECYKNHA